MWVRADRIELDGAAVDLATVIERARVAGAAEVRATGDAITGVVWNVLMLGDYDARHDGALLHEYDRIVAERSR